MVGDEVMVTQSGKETLGLAIFFLDLQQAVLKRAGVDLSLVVS